MKCISTNILFSFISNNSEHSIPIFGQALEYVNNIVAVAKTANQKELCMYMNRRITVNLTTENQSKLEKPSKVFNKVKATFTQTMTPAEASRAEVMLSVLQRINKSLRSADICNLVSLAVNGETIYQDEEGIENDLKEGALTFVRDKNDSNITVFKRLEQIVEHTTNGILFVYDINVLQKPKDGRGAVTIAVSGFPSEFKLEENENISDFDSRITSFVKENLSAGEQVQQFNDKYLRAFDEEVDRFELALDQFFPAGCSTEKYKMRLLSKGDQGRLNKRIGTRFESNILFMHYWLDTETLSNFDDNEGCDELFDIGLCDWFDDVLDSGSESSWIDSVSGSFSDAISNASSDDSSDSASCGSSCGGGCGG